MTTPQLLNYIIFNCINICDYYYYFGIQLNYFPLEIILPDSNGDELLGALDLAFLFSYAVGMFFRLVDFSTIYSFCAVNMLIKASV